jgi:hypothetical protein
MYRHVSATLCRPKHTVCLSALHMGSHICSSHTLCFTQSHIRKVELLARTMAATQAAVGTSNSKPQCKTAAAAVLSTQSPSKIQLDAAAVTQGGCNFNTPNLGCCQFAAGAVNFSLSAAPQKHITATATCERLTVEQCRNKTAPSTTGTISNLQCARLSMATMPTGVCYVCCNSRQGTPCSNNPIAGKL